MRDSQPFRGFLKPLSILGFAAVISACSSAGSMQDGDALASADADADPRKCRTITPIGTKIGHRVCKKQSEWEAEASAATLVSDTQRRVNQGNGIGQD